MQNNFSDELKELSDEEYVFEILMRTIQNMPQADREKFLNLLREGGKINGR